MATQLTVTHIFKQCQDIVSKEPPIAKEGLVPQDGEHLHQGRLAYTCFSLNNDRDATLETLMDLKHLKKWQVWK